ncbi:hypothetical protein E2562_023518 [Oryza meyeriana var. granulata]|uniref:Uncharacterized protein n=1 Tax=Oryza meyeriana var. granulata TaxID=110450 RepID=A0A6G1E108_9ORYZ|nr:hypothetical protein E2562_023518 [Oryza meyeriana var. granulata]KAF0918351.1 hypothetical protein E2562_023518 [Oryza meyeriana var. granulata]KAF0918352.1 hypothetical protein E2562_023518 [Oryza meyeriana var. granulata]
MAVESWNSFRHKQMEARLTEDDKDYFDSLIEDRVASGEKIMPQLRNIKDSEYLKKVWGWERLLPYDGSVAWSHCINYLENYYYNCNAHEQVPGAAAATGAAELCFATEADLICESLRHGADLTDYLVDQSCEIRMCALSLMYCSPDHSVAAATAMVVHACLLHSSCQNPLNFVQYPSFFFPFYYQLIGTHSVLDDFNSRASQRRPKLCMSG